MASRIRALLCSACVLVAFASPGFAQLITEVPVSDGTIPFRITTGPDGALEALQAGETGVLLIPLDLSAYRMNIGVRTLDAATAFTLTVRNAGGGVVASIPRFFPAVHQDQQSASAF